MARLSDGRIGVSVNAETITVLDAVRDSLKARLGISASYTQAIQYLGDYYLKNQDNLTASKIVPEGE
jgi:hypothetical protein